MGAPLFDVEKLVSSILLVVNFFAARIIVVCLLFALLYWFAGEYYFQLAAAYWQRSPLTEADLRSLIDRAEPYMSSDNIKNVLFAVALIVSLSLLDITYRVIGRLGGVLPVTMIYDASYSSSLYWDGILDAWRYYSKKFTPFSFRTFVENKAAADSSDSSVYGWWKDLFDYSKSFIVIAVLIYIATPYSALQVTSLDLAYYCFLAAICMFVCTMIESARYANDMSVALHKTILTLIHEAEEEAISDAEFETARREVTFPEGGPWRPRSRFFCVSLSVSVSYFGSLEEWVRAFKERLAKARASAKHYLAERKKRLR